jgi:hypothetical protein
MNYLFRDKYKLKHYMLQHIMFLIQMFPINSDLSLNLNC